jgi:hypothetical protein
MSEWQRVGAPETSATTTDQNQSTSSDGWNKITPRKEIETAFPAEQIGTAVRGYATGALGSLGDIAETASKVMPSYESKGALSSLVRATGIPYAVEAAKFIFPTSKQLESGIQSIESAVGAEPGVSPKYEKLRRGAEFVGEVSPFGVGAGAIGKKAIDKAAKLISEYRGIPLEQALNLFKKSTTDLASTAKERIKDIESAETLASREALKSKQGILKESQQQSTGASTKLESDALAKLSKTKDLSDDFITSARRIAESNLKLQRDAREFKAIEEIKNPVFDQARKLESTGVRFNNNPETKELHQQLMDEMKLQISRAPIEFQKPLTERLKSLENMSFDQAEFYRRMFNEGSFGDIEGFKALQANQQGAAAKLITDMQNSFSPGHQEWIKEYQNWSQKIDAIRDNPIGKQMLERYGILADKPLYSADPNSLAQQALSSQQAAQQLKLSVGGKTAPLENSIRAYLRNELQNKSAAETKAFVNNLEGFGREFKDIYVDLQNLADARLRAEQLATRASNISTRRQDVARGSMGERAQISEIARGNERLVNDFIKDMSEGVIKKESLPDAARNFIGQLSSEGKKIITPEQAGEAIKAIEKVDLAKLNQKDAARTLGNILRRSLYATGGSALLGGGYAINQLFKND